MRRKADIRDLVSLLDDEDEGAAIEARAELLYLGDEVLPYLAENDPGFLRWIMRSDFADDVKSVASNALIGKFPERNAKQS